MEEEMSGGNVAGGDRLAVAAADIMFVEVSGETVLLDPRSGVYFGLDPVGTLVWRELATPRTVNELVTAVCESFDVGRAECESDVAELLDTLREHGLVTDRDAP
jgi:hypothetical protein